MSVKKTNRVITKNSTMFKNNYATFKGAVKSMINNWSNPDLSETTIVSVLKSNYPNMYIDDIMVSNVCKELMHVDKFFQGSNSSNGVITYQLYSQGNLKTSINCTQTATGVSVPKKNITLDEMIKKHPELTDILDPVIHLSTSKKNNNYELVTQINTTHLKNICKKQIKNWNPKSSSYKEFISKDKYFKELMARESII